MKCLFNNTPISSGEKGNETKKNESFEDQEGVFLCQIDHFPVHLNLFKLREPFSLHLSEITLNYRIKFHSPCYFGRKQRAQLKFIRAGREAEAQRGEGWRERGLVRTWQ
jgi:hypothetical protein